MPLFNDVNPGTSSPGTNEMENLDVTLFSINDSSTSDGIGTSLSSIDSSLGNLTDSPPPLPMVCTPEHFDKLQQTDKEILRNIGYTEDDIEHALTSLNKNSDIEENIYGRSRPTTHVFWQGKVFTYPKLEVPETTSRKIRGTLKTRYGSVNSDCRGTQPALDPDDRQFDVGSVVPKTSTNDLSLTCLKNIRIENLNNVIIGQLNINSLRNKFYALKTIIQGNIDVLILTETKIDNTFPQSQFYIPGYKVPYRRDRDGYGGGVMLYVREDIPSDILIKHRIDEDLEAIFVEINLRKA